MRNLVYGCLIVGGVFTGSALEAQVTITDTAYNTLKIHGDLNPTVQYQITNTSGTVVHHQDLVATPKSNNCACYTPHDGTWTLAMAPNDDGSTANIPIPFNFCLYGSTYTSLWINNNGNITFDNSYSTFSAVGFPDPSYVMVAPFWADVDTRGIGAVYYKITPTALYVNWENVGYFNSYTDKTNTFSLIITDATDPVIGAGNNVAFCYQDMQWTTGDASSGVNGFGGTAATVGCNKGDGVAFVQFGRFDSPGTAFFGPYATNNGVSWLDNQSFIFNACNATNIAPAIAGGINVCDTLYGCQGDTLIDTLTFLSPEAGQTTTLSASSTSPDFSVLNITNGNIATIIYRIIGNTPGTITFTVTATDDGVPVQAPSFTFTLDVLPANTVPDPIISGDSLLCPGHNAQLQVSNSVYDSYLWNTGSTLDSITVLAPGIYWVECYVGICHRSDSISIPFKPGPEVYIMDSLICDGLPVNINCSIPNNEPIATFDWTFSTGSPSSSTDSSEIVTFPGSGTYPISLTIETTEGCTTTVTQNMTVLNSSNPDFGVYPICISRFTFDPLPGSGDSSWVVNWSMGDGITFLNQDTSFFNYIYANPGDYWASMAVTNSYGCTDTVWHLVQVQDTLSVVMPNVLVHSSTIGNNKFDMEVIKPNFNLCIEYTYTVFDRWGVKMFEVYNDPYNPDLYCNHCFEGKSSTGASLVPGVYYYTLKGNFHIEKHGFFTVFD